MHKAKKYIWRRGWSNGRIRSVLLLALCSLLFLTPSGLIFAQTDGSGKLSITIAPPLFQISIAPGTLWQSVLRVVNTNHYPLVVHTNVADFRPSGETGNAVFDTLSQGSALDTLRMSGWITVPSGDITIPPDASYEIPFSINVPINADPGGHYAALMVGTIPPDHVEGGGASVGSILTSLIFLRVPGEVVEEGLIRDFYTEHGFVSTPEQSFVMRFENMGNVHLVPQGHIAITNMWGKERGRILVNEKSSFGNVLPGTTRKFQFSWKGEPSLFDIGRYKVEAVLSYGEENKQSAIRTISFWIIPWKPVSITLGSILFLIWFFTWAIRRYIRKALELERSYHHEPHRDASGVSTHAMHAKAESKVAPRHSDSRVTIALLKRPLIEGVADLSRRHVVSTVATSKRGHHVSAPKYTYMQWAKKYRMFILSVTLFVLGCVFAGWYFVEVFKDERAYQVTEIRPQG